jgi:nanoRNase/pAp phosphatase (c-di-AMP/oligoRNAs hydrolase)
VSPLIPLHGFKRKKLCLITHAGADVDAIAATGTLAIFLSKGNSVVIGVPDHISLGAKRLAKALNVKYQINPSLKDFDTLVFVDLNSLDMIGSMASAVEEFSGEKFVIDHHSKGGEQIAQPKNSWIESEAVASCSLIFEFFKKHKLPIDSDMATLLACGITADSAHFLTANSGTFAVMSKLLEISKKRFSEILELLRVERKFSEKIAMIKAAKRSRIFKLGKFILVTAEVGAFESDAAGALIRVGADIAFVGNSENRELKISGRANQKLLRETGLSLARDIFQPLASYFKGSGGGHAGAAGFNGGNADPMAALQKCIELARKKIAMKKAGVQLKEYT